MNSGDTKSLRAKWTVVAGRTGGALIKGTLRSEPEDGLFPAFSASGQDVWTTEAEYHGSGIVVSAVGARCGKAFRADGRWTAIANTHVLLPRSGFDRDYLWWIFNDEEFWLKGGAAQPYVQFEPSLEKRIYAPPLPEQRRIAAYLDTETGRIDTLVAEKERMLALLEEKRAALVSRVVTRGLPPDAAARAGLPVNPPLKPSGLPWLGDIPSHWEVRRLKFVADVRGGLTLGKYYGSTRLVEYPYLRVANVQDGHLNLDVIATVTIPQYEATNYMLKKGDVLMNEGGDADKLGRGAVWTGGIDPCLHQNHVFAVRPFGVSSDWLDTWTSSAGAKCYFESRAKRATNLASISATNIRELPIPLPPLAEQRAIVAFLKAERERTAELEAALRESIALLRERRRALITAAVTGQIPPEAMTQ